MLVPITDTIYKLVVPFPKGGDVNCFFLKGEHGRYTLVDTGIRSEQSIALWEKVLAEGISIDKIVLTHTHPDHIGMADWLQRRFKIPVAMSKLGHETMRKMNSRLLQLERMDGEDEPYTFFQKHGGPAITLSRIIKQMSSAFFEPDEIFEDGHELRLGNGRWKAIWTPGHAPDHFCFSSEDNRILVIGDHVLGDISPVITIWSDDGGNPLSDYFESLDKINDSPAKLILPGHGQVIPDLQRRIAELIRGHHYRMREIMDIITDGELSAGEISKRLYNNSGEPGRFMVQLQSTLARLIYLESQGKVSSRMQDGIILFSGK